MAAWLTRSSPMAMWRMHEAGLRTSPGPLQCLFFTCMLSHAVQDLEVVVYIRYHLDSFLFDLRRLTAKMKSLQTPLQEVLYADDCALVAHAEQDLQRMLDCFSEASKLFGLTISLRETEVLHQPAPIHPLSPTITIDDKPLANVEHFKYLGSAISCDVSLDREIDTRISKASQVLGSLRNWVLSKHNICLSTKLQVYNAVVPPLRLWDVDTVLQAYQETGSLPHASSPLQPGNQVAGPHHQFGGPRSS